MSGYRRGAVLGLTVAETFILLTFLLLIALLGLVYRDEPIPEPDTARPPGVWVRPEEIETLVNAAGAARKAQEEAEQARVAAERERDQAREVAGAARKAREEAERARTAAERERDQAQEVAGAAREAREEAEQARVAAERERDQAQEVAEVARKAREEAERARAAAERERDQAQEVAGAAREAREEAERARIGAERERDQAYEKAEEARKAEEEVEQARVAAERERDRARRDLALFRRKGENPPCWYQIVSAGEGKEREKAYYAFNVAIYEDSIERAPRIELAPRRAPPGGADDDGGGPYAGEWKRLRIDELPYGKKLNEAEFTKAVQNLVAQGRNGQVRTYECVFSVMVWDKTPDHAKKVWQDAHDRIIEGLFSAYTVQDLEWKGVESRDAGGIRVQ